MFIRLVRFKLTDAGRAHAQTMADDMVAAIKQQPGCQGVAFFGGNDGDSGLTVFWDTQEHANAAAGVIRPMLDKHLAGNVDAPPDARLFQVLAN
jgi:quinol monooxygenase YgiN